MTQTEIGYVPALLQTESYARALLAVTPGVSEDKAGLRVNHLLRRQQVINRGSRCLFEFFIHEYALRRPGVSRANMCEQIHHLLRLNVRPQITIRIITEMAGTLVKFSPFRLFEFADFNPSVCVELSTSIAFVERADTVGTYRQILSALDVIALDGYSSREWLTEAGAVLGDGDDPAL